MMIMSEIDPILLVGGAPVDPADVAWLRPLCGPVVTADSGTDRAQAAGLQPDWAVGDFDSVSFAGLARVAPDRRLHVVEQETTDFEKALTHIQAPAVLCLGFTGRRIDHELAVYSALVRFPERRAIVIGARDICFHARELRLDLPLGSRVSLFPMVRVTGRSEGLLWPIEGLILAPEGRLGTSNRVTGPVTVRFDSDGALVILPKAALSAVLASWGVSPPGRSGVRGR